MCCYEVITDVIEGSDTEEANTLRLDAPSGSFVVSAIGRLIEDPPVSYDWGFLGYDTINHSSAGPGCHRLVLDGQGRITGVDFTGFAEVESSPGPDVEAGIVCVSCCEPPE